MNQGNSQRKGLHPLAWVGIGCGGLVVIAVIFMVVAGFFVAKKVGAVAADFEENPAKAAAEMMVKLNPDIEMVDTDDEKGTITVRDRKTGKVVTVNFSDIKNGKLVFSTDEGEMTIEGNQANGVTVAKNGERTVQFGDSTNWEKIPSWIPRYEGTAPDGFFSSSSQGENSGSCSIQTTDDPEQILDFYQEKLEESGFEVQRQTIATGKQKVAVLSATRESEGKQIQLTAVKDEGASETNLMLNYTEKTP